MTTPHEHIHDVAVLGASHAGLGLAATLACAGVPDVAVLDPAPDLTAVARQTGATAPAVLYDYGVLQPHDWRHLYPTTSEQADYLQRLAELLPRPVEHGADVVGLARCGTELIWKVSRADGGQHTARTIVVDALRWPAPRPAPRGLEQFRGRVIEAAAVDPDDLAGQVVGLVTTPAEAAGLLPSLVDTARRVKVFQRDPAWVLPHPNPHVPSMVRRALGAIPRARQATTWVLAAGHLGMDRLAAPGRATAPVRDALARHHLRRTVADPWARERLTPGSGGRRAVPTLASSTYYPALQHPTCNLISWPVAGVSAHGVRTADGIEHHVDVLVVPSTQRATLAVADETVPSIDEGQPPCGGVALPDLHVLRRPPGGRGPAEWVETFAHGILEHLHTGAVSDTPHSAPRVARSAG